MTHKQKSNIEATGKKPLLILFMALLVVCATAMTASAAIGGVAVTKVSPNNNAPGTVITIEGSGFRQGGTSDTQVNFGDYSAGIIPSTKFITWSDSLIRVEVPKNIDIGTNVDITVKVFSTTSTESVTSDKTSKDKFTFAPEVSGIFPAAGASGTLVTISGKGFTGANEVDFGTTSAGILTGSDVIVKNDNTIEVTAPTLADKGAIVDVIVKNNGASSTTWWGDRFTYITLPVITKLVPDKGPTDGGNEVQIMGTGLSAVTEVYFGANKASIVSTADNMVTVIAPPGARIQYDVDVYVKAGSLKSNSLLYDYISGPVVGSINPALGPIDGGNKVTITGSYFDGSPLAVTFGGNAADIVSSTDSKIVVTAPKGTVGTVDVIVSLGNAKSLASANSKYTYYALPSISSLTPNAGPVAGTNTVKISGAYFNGVSSVTFGGKPATIVGTPQDNEITVTAPAGSAGTIDVLVNANGGSSLATDKSKYTYVTGPVITGITPANGPLSGNTVVTLKGSGFSGATAVKFGTADAVAFKADSDSQITATAPAGAAGAVVVTVSTTGGASTSTPNQYNQFTYVAGPVISGLAPNSGPATGKTAVTITGSGFTGVTEVKFGDNAATALDVVSDTKITVKSPAGVAGTVDVTVAGPGGKSDIVAADKFTYTGTLPVIKTVSPSKGGSAGGNIVTLTGTGFTGATEVNFGDNPATEWVVDSDKKITVTAPAGSGKVDITVTTSAGTSELSKKTVYTYNSPKVTQVSPSSGSSEGGNTVEIYGKYLTGVEEVYFGEGNSASDINPISDTKITVTAPAGSGTVDVTVATAGATSAETAKDKYTYVSAPTITSISPATGAANGGNTVTLAGTGFTGATAVKFGASAATNLKVVSDTEITVTAPKGTGTVDVTVTTPSGTSAAVKYTYTANAPVITSISPTKGTVKGGTTVYIYGSNFNGVTAVKFGNNPSKYFTINTSGTKITAKSPAGTKGTIYITVTGPGGTSATTSKAKFTYY